MLKFFTKNLFLVVLSFVAIDMMGQKLNTLVIEAPAGAGSYTAVRAAFGTNYSTTVSGDAAFGTDGTTNGTLLCAAATNSLTGKIGFVDRGGCTPAVNGEFGSKALKAQQAGAVAVIICNNLANQNQAPFSMTIGTNGAQVTVPTFMISYADCQKIRASILAGTAKATLRNVCANTGTYAPEVVWGNGADANGNRGDFTGGLNGWTVDKENTWEFDGDGEILGGAFGGTVMDSWTDCNGIMKFNSDFQDNGGSQTGSGTGKCPAVCTGALISPNITLPAGVKGISVEFNQATRQFRSNYFLMASKDNGVTWPDTVALNTSLPVNSGVINERISVPLLGYAGATQIRIKFEYAGNYYYWGVDDVVIKNEVVVDTRVNTNFFAVAPTLRVPRSQTTEMYFLADIANIGNGDATGVDLDLAISKDGAAPIVLKNTYGNVAAGTTLENDLFDDTYTPANEPAFYDAAYIIKSGEDKGNANDTARFFFEVTENTFGNLLPESEVTPANYMRDIAAIWAVSDDITNYYSGGNMYYVSKGKGGFVETARFGLANTAADVEGSGFVNIELFEWVDENEDGGCQPTERTLVGANNIFLEAIDNLRNIELPLWGVDGDGQPVEDKKIELNDETMYFLVAHTSPLDPSSARYQFLTYSGFSQTSSLDRSIYPVAANFALEQAGETRRGGSLFELSGAGTDDVADRSFTILGNSATLFSFATMYLEMDITNPPVSTFNIAKAGTANVFPNPANRELYIDVTLDNVSDVRVDLVSIEGKTVTTKSFEGVQDSRLKLDLGNLVSGTYTALIHTDKGVITKKVVVQK
jgi:hypothetical protein